jgi:hypothetical protein
LTCMSLPTDDDDYEMGEEGDDVDGGDEKEEGLLFSSRLSLRLFVPLLNPSDDYGRIRYKHIARKAQAHQEIGSSGNTKFSFFNSRLTQSLRRLCLQRST